MFDDKNTNKYLIIGLIIVLVVVIVLYFKKKSCNVEKMTQLDLTPVERPWAEDDDAEYKTVKKTKCKKKSKKQVSVSDSSENPEPMPLDPRPDLGNCVPCKPCVCPKNKKN